MGSADERAALPEVSLTRLVRCARDGEMLQAILEEAPGYSVAVTGLPPAADAGRALLEELPVGTDERNKYVFAVREGDELVGCADVLRGYPEPTTAFLGLLLIAESRQGEGLGRRVSSALESVMREWGCTKVRLAVVESNECALGFWSAVGFVDTGERVDYQNGRVDSLLILMEKRLDQVGQ